MQLLSSAILLACAVSSLWAEVTLNEEPTAVQANISQLQTTIGVNQSVYVPGELAIITISISNPTNRVLEVPSPFWPERTGIDLLQRSAQSATADGVDYHYVAPHPYSVYLPSPEGDTILLQPGEQITKAVRSDALVFSGRPLLPSGCVPLRPGEYRIAYSYDPRAHADFRVVRPVLEAFASFVSNHGERKYEDGTKDVVAQGVNIFAVMLDDKHVILATTVPWPANTEVTPRVREQVVRDGSHIGAIRAHQRVK